MASAAPLRSPHGRHSAGATRHYPLAIAALIGIAVVLAGGASRADEPQQILVRLAAIAALAASLWPLHFARLAEHRRWLIGVAAGYALLGLQLVPIPPALWEAIPGRALYATIAAEAGVTGWRPLSLTPDLTVNALLGLLPATAMLLAALQLGARDRLWLFRGAVAAALFSALLGLVQLAAGGESLHLYRTSSEASAVGLFANRNHNAALLACALPLLGALAARLEGRRGILPLTFGLAAALLLGIIATGSRMGLVLGGLGLSGFAWNARGLLGAGRGLLLAGAMLSLGLAMALVAWRIGLVDRLAGGDTLTDSRIALLGPMAATAAAMAPWGAGFGSFDSVFRQFEPDWALSTIYMNHAHNEPLELAIEGGVPALLLLAAFLIWWGRAAGRILRSGPRRSGPLALTAVMVTAMLMLASLVDYPLRTPLLGALFALACAEMLRAGVAIARAGQAA